MSSPTQNSGFLPKGWREAAHGGIAPAGSEALYTQTVATPCRSCHFNRPEISLDFGTAANFAQEPDLLELALKAYCNANTRGYGIDPNPRPMPLASLTFLRFWQANLDAPLAKFFGFPATAGYCATNPQVEWKTPWIGERLSMGRQPMAASSHLPSIRWKAARIRCCVEQGPWPWARNRVQRCRLSDQRGPLAALDEAAHRA